MNSFLFSPYNKLNVKFVLIFMVRCICTQSSCEQNSDETQGNLCGALLPSCGGRWAYSFILDFLFYR